MFEVRWLVFLLCSMTACAFVPPQYGCHNENYKAKQELLGIAGTSNLVSLTDFKSLQEQNAPLVDKTNFIADFMNDVNTHIIITRPRGFGKSFAYSMLYHFLNINGSNTDLFKGTSVARNRGVCLAHQHQYPVIRVSFRELESAKTWEEAVVIFKATFRNMLKEHTHVIDTNPEEIMTIHTLSNRLHERLKKKSIVLIDDFDTPIRTAFYNGYYGKMVVFFRQLYQSAFINNPAVYKSLALGESAINKEEIFSKVENLTSYTITDSQYESYFGFDKTETIKLIQTYRLDAGLIKSMVQKYGGYRFGDYILLNPYSVTQCLKNEGKFMNYWMDSARDFIQLMSNSGIVPLFESELLLMADSINYVHDVPPAYPAIKHDLNAFWTLVTDSGYVAIAEKQQDRQGKFKCKLVLPNDETANGFGRFVSDYYAKHKNIVRYTDWMKIILSRDSSGTLDCLESYFDSALQYFAAERVNDPLCQMRQLVQALFKGLKKYYRMYLAHFDKDVFTVALKGRPSDLPIRISMTSWDGARESYKCAKLGTMVGVYCSRLFKKVRFGSIVAGDKVVMFVIMDLKGNLLQQFIDFIDRWIGDPVQHIETQIRTCLKNWFFSHLK